MRALQYFDLKKRNASDTSDRRAYSPGDRKRAADRCLPHAAYPRLRAPLSRKGIDGCRRDPRYKHNQDLCARRGGRRQGGGHEGCAARKGDHGRPFLRLLQKIIILYNFSYFFYATRLILLNFYRFSMKIPLHFFLLMFILLICKHILTFSAIKERT